MAGAIFLTIFKLLIPALCYFIVLQHEMVLRLPMDTLQLVAIGGYYRT